MKYFVVFLLAIGVWFLLPDKVLPTNVVQSSDSSALHFDVENLLSLTNQQRVGLTQLIETTELDRAAERKCQDMETRNYWAHSINGEPFQQFDPPADKIGENLSRGYGTPEAVVEAWMNSEEHRQNLLDPVFTKVGFAYCQGPQYNLVVQELES